MRRLILFVCLAALSLPLTSGCSKPTKKRAGPPPRIEPTNRQLRLLRLERIDPYSERGQQILKKRNEDRAELKKILDRRDKLVAERREIAEEMRRRTQMSDPRFRNPPSRR